MRLPPRRVDDRDLYSLSGKGRAELRNAGTSLTPAQVQALVLTDGRTKVAAISERVGLEPERGRAVFADFLQRGLVESSPVDRLQNLDEHFRSRVRLRDAEAEDEGMIDAEPGLVALATNGFYVAIAHAGASVGKARAAGRRTVLVVEDDAAVLGLLVFLLGKEGFDVRTAVDRDSILAGLREAPIPDLVLLDVLLPDADGYHVLERIRAHPELANVPVILVTSLASRHSVAKGLALGANGYLTKPVSAGVLVKAVRAVCGPAPAG
ncbi:MAG: response regulator [Betaproteobacteria bacterium]